MDDKKKEVKGLGFTTNLFGRIRNIPELLDPSWKVREKAEREIINTIVQGTAVDIVKQMMMYMKSILDPVVRFVLQVHDEMVLEVPDSMVDTVIEQAKELAVMFPDYPCKVTVGKNYGNMEEIKEG
jgi:DNA polymerase-1